MTGLRTSPVLDSLSSPPSRAARPAAPHATPPDLAESQLAAMRRQIDARLAEFLEVQRADYLRQPVLAGLYDEAVEFVLRPGKRLRPLLFLLAERIFSPAEPKGASPSPELLSAAISLELLHAFILIHDDIIDRSDSRRGLPSLHRGIEARLSSFIDRHRTGRNLALVLGDVLFAFAQKCLLESAVAPPAILARLSSLQLDCMVETGFGEAADIVYGTRDVAKVGLTEIEAMYTLKTTRYTIECPLAMAATLHGIHAGGLDSLSRIAKPAGLAFQIQNDLAEFSRFEISDAEVPGDILEGKKTLLMRTAFELLDETDRALLQLCFTACGPSEGTVSKAHDLMVKSGAVRLLTERMESLFARADAEIASSDFTSTVQGHLADLINLVRSAACVEKPIAHR